MDCGQTRRGVWVALLAVALLPAAIACSKSGGGRKLTVAYSGIGDPNSWFESFSIQMAAEAGARGHVFHRKIATYDNNDEKHQESQIQDVTDLISMTGPDVLVLAPVAVNRARDAVQVANEKGVPVIIVNRDAEEPPPPGYVSNRYFSTIHSDFKAFGKEVCGKHLRRIFGRDRQIRILHLKGTLGGSNTIGMAEGCEDAAQADGNITFPCWDVGNYDLPQSIAAAKRQITAGCDFNAVFGHGDTEGVGAVMALMEAAVTNPKYKPGTDPARARSS